MFVMPVRMAFFRTIDSSRWESSLTSLRVFRFRKGATVIVHVCNYTIIAIANNVPYYPYVFCLYLLHMLRRL